MEYLNSIGPSNSKVNSCSLIINFKEEKDENNFSIYYRFYFIILFISIFYNYARKKS